MENELLKNLKELMHCYSVCNDPKNPVNEEITMWRTKFLETMDETRKLNKFIIESFLYMPSESFMLRSAKENYEIVISLEHRYPEKGS